MLRTARYHFRATVRARWRSFLGGIVVFGLLGGVSLAAVAGARRTASTYSRFLDQSRAPTMVFDAGAFDPEIDEAVRELPEVADAATYVGFNAAPLDDEGNPDLENTDVEVLGSVNGRFFRVDRPAVVQGRLPDPNRGDEAAVNEALLEDGGYHLGQRVEFGLYTDDQVQADDFGDNTPPPAGRGEVAIVGVVAFGDEVVQGDAERYGRVLLTPAFTRPNLAAGSYAWQAILLRNGDADVVAVQEKIRRLLPQGVPALFRVTSTDVDRTQRAVRPLALALGAFGLLAGLATALLVSQAVVRGVRLASGDVVILRSLGAARASLGAVALAGPLLMVVIGALSAVAVAVALSPIAPLGAARRFEPHPGVAVDWAVLGVGMAASAVVLVGVMAATVARQARGLRRRSEGRRWAWRPSRVAAAAAAGGMPPSVVIGTRMALEGGAGGPDAPAATRSAMTGAVIAVIALASSLCFSSSLRALVNHPRLYGWNWDIALEDEVGYGDIDQEKAHAVLDADHDVAGWAPAAFGGAPIDGSTTALLGVDPANPLTPPVLSGRRLQSADEIVLGPDTLARLHKQVGDVVTFGAGAEGTPLRVVGTATFPAIGPLRGALTGLGTGAMVARSLVPTFADEAGGNGEVPVNTVFIRLRAGAGSAVAERLHAALEDAGIYPGSIGMQKVQRPAEIVNSQSMGLAPAVLAVVVAVAVLLSLALALMASVRRRRRELALLKVLGFTRRQLGWAVVSHATLIAVIGLGIGLPLGVALGRWLWVLFANQLSVVPTPTVPIGLLAVVAIGVVALSNLVATLPAAMASRTPTAEILRSD